MTNSFKTWLKAPVGTYGKSVDDPKSPHVKKFRNYLDAPEFIPIFAV